MLSDIATQNELKFLNSEELVLGGRTLYGEKGRREEERFCNKIT